MMNNFMNGMFGKIGSGMCKLSMSGNIAVKTSLVNVMRLIMVTPL